MARQTAQGQLELAVQVAHLVTQVEMALALTLVTVAVAGVRLAVDQAGQVAQLYLALQSPHTRITAQFTDQ